MDLAAAWESVAALRRVEFVVLLVTIVVPVLSSSMVLTLRHRIKILQSRSSQTQGVFHQGEVSRLEDRSESLSDQLSQARRELAVLRQMTAPRQLSHYQEDLLLERLRGIKTSPVVVTAYAFEEESAVYAKQIAAVLRKANWEVTLNKASMNDFKGVAVSKIALMHQTVPGLRELTQAMTEAKLDIHPHDIHPDTIAGEVPDGTLLVVVGRR